MDLDGRKEVFRALVGSHNYNLNTETSDKDYKIFVVPTFDDLYFNKQFSKSLIGDTEDFDCHDIRKIPNLWWKANVNFLEVLYSEELYINPELNEVTKGYIQTIFDLKDEIVKMNLPYLYNACIGMHVTKKGQIDKGTMGTQHLVDKFGYDTKQAMHSIRILDFLLRFADNNFSDFKKAIWYEGEYDSKDWLLGLKNGCFSKEEFLNISKVILKLVQNNYKDIYLSQKPNKELNDELIRIIKEIVKIELQTG